MDNRTEKQKSNLRLLNYASKVREVAKNKGGTDELRKQLTKKQADKLRKKRKMAKESRKANRKGAK